MSYCPKCGKEYDDSLPECPYCQAEQTNLEIQEDNNSPEISGAPSGGEENKKVPKGAIAGIIAAVVVIAAVIFMVIMLIPKNGDQKDGGSGSSSSDSSSGVEELTMPSGYEEIVNDIKDSDGHIITQSTDPYGNTITREVDSNGNVTTTFVGPDGSTSRVTTDQNGNILSYDIPASGGEASVSSTPNNNANTNNSGNTSSGGTSSGNTGSGNTSSGNTSSGNASSGGSGESSNAANGAITINGKSYKVGDTVTLKGTLGGINEAVAGCVLQVTYDENLLELDEDSLKLFDSSFMTNTNLSGEILASAMNPMTGFDLAAPRQVIECKFKVKDSDTKSCDINFAATEVYTGIGSNPVVDVTASAESEFTVE